MCKTCGLVVNDLSMNRGRMLAYPQGSLSNLGLRGNKSRLFLSLHNFYTHSYTLQNLFFQSVISNFYTFCTRLIITKTMYI